MTAAMTPAGLAREILFCHELLETLSHSFIWKASVHDTMSPYCELMDWEERAVQELREVTDG